MEVDDIKLKYISLTTAIIIFFTIFTLLITKNCIAEDEKGIHFVGEPSYRETNTIIKNNKVIGKSFEINITLHNAGEKKSNILIVNISDEDDSLQQETYLEPDETQIISFNWSTIKIRNQRIQVQFYPKDLDTIWNEFNSGSTAFIIEISTTGGLPATSMPGFEAIFLILLIILLLILNKNPK